jgi:hypothetical protein
MFYSNGPIGAQTRDRPGSLPEGSYELISRHLVRESNADEIGVYRHSHWRICARMILR